VYCVGAIIPFFSLFSPTRSLKVPSAVIPSEPKITLTVLEKSFFWELWYCFTFVQRGERGGLTKLMSCHTMLDTSALIPLPSTSPLHQISNSNSFVEINGHCVESLETVIQVIWYGDLKIKLNITFFSSTSN
jgi:hypothetical protein